ncbi:hypothetical protein TYRP_002673 [Tyrophagus putrescentiae]|nr:hypothetical protein TYRP_002673 [Tyrophagus putrescentiae]
MAAASRPAPNLTVLAKTATKATSTTTEEMGKSSSKVCGGCDGGDDAGVARAICHDHCHYQ